MLSTLDNTLNPWENLRKHVSIRPMAPADFHRIVEYWFRASPADLARMGAQAAHLGTRESMSADLASLFTQADTQVPESYLIWQIGGRDVGHCALKEIQFGREGGMHLHMWEVAERGKGWGQSLFCLSAVAFYERFKLQKVTCEPSAANPMPNRMLQKIGFVLERTYVGASSKLSAICELNRYFIDRDVALAFLARVDQELFNAANEDLRRP